MSDFCDVSVPIRASTYAIWLLWRQIPCSSVCRGLRSVEAVPSIGEEVKENNFFFYSQIRGWNSVQSAFR